MKKKQKEMYDDILFVLLINDSCKSEGAKTLIPDSHILWIDFLET